jgi:hypothetical protein
MIRLETSKLKDLIKTWGKNLGDKSLNVEQGKLEIKDSESADVGDTTFNADILASAEVMLFNSRDDRDSDGIIGLEDENKDDLMKLGPQIEFGEGSAWLKYRFKGGLKGSGSLNVSALDISAAAGKSITFNSYRIHSPGENLMEAIQEDAESLRCIVKKDDIFKLENQEALSMQRTGTLEGNISLKWSDIFTGNLGGLCKLIGLDEIIKIDVGASAEVSFNWKLEDDFILVFTRLGDDRFRLGVKKAKSKKNGGALTCGLDVKLSNEEALENILENVYNALLGEKITLLEDILNKTDPGKALENQANLQEKEKQVISAIMDRLNLDCGEECLKSLTERLAKLKEDAKAAVKKLAEVKVKLGFSYEYNRIQTNATVLQAILSKEAVNAHHESLIKQKISGVLDGIKNNREDYVLEKFLNEKTLEIKEAWGASLGIGKWSLSGKDFKNIKYVTRENIHGHKQICYLGTRGYKDKVGDKTVRFNVDFNAEMNGLSRFGEPLAREFDYGLSLTWRWENPKLDDLPVIIDHAALWRAVTVNEDEDMAATLQQELDGKKDLEISSHLNYSAQIN